MNDEIHYEMRRAVDTLLQEHMLKEDRRFEEMQLDIKHLREDMKAFTDAWQQAKGVVTFIKWITAIAGGLVTAFIFMKDHLK